MCEQFVSIPGLPVESRQIVQVTLYPSNDDVVIVTVFSILDVFHFLKTCCTCIQYMDEYNEHSNYYCVMDGIDVYTDFL